MNISKKTFEEWKVSLKALLEDVTYKESSANWLTYYQEMFDKGKLKQNVLEEDETSVRVYFPFSLNPLSISTKGNLIDNCVSELENPNSSHTNIWVASTVYPDEIKTVIKIIRGFGFVPIEKDRVLYGEF